MFSSRYDVGLDIGEQKIKLVQMKKKRRGIMVSRYGSIKTPPGTIKGGFITDPESLGHELAGLVRKLKLKGKDTVSAVSGQQIYTKLLTMQAMPLDEIRQATYFQASTFLPISIDEVSSDIFPVREFEDKEGTKNEVLFVAARRAQVDNLYLACSIAGLKLTRVEIEPLALCRTFNNEIDKERVVAVLNIGASRSYVAIFKDGIMVFMRSISFGCSAFYQTQGSDKDHLLETIDAREGSYGNLLSDIVNELTRSIDYYEIQNKEDLIDKIIICGGGSRIKGIDTYLSSALNQQVVIGEPGPKILFPKALNEEAKKDLRHDFPVALGLALRGGE